MRIDISTPARFETENSIWHLDSKNRYLREPRGDRQGATLCIDSALDDGTWIEYRSAWIEHHPYALGEFRIGLIPSARGEGSSGIRSGVIVSSSVELPVLTTPSAT
jgi:hypothetical protein